MKLNHKQIPEDRAIVRLKKGKMAIRSPGSGATCEKCAEFSSLAELKNYERKGSLDIQKYLNIYMGADDVRPLIHASGEYVMEYYPEAYKKAYSLPEGYVLKTKDFNKLQREARKGDTDIPFDECSVAMVFDKVKETYKNVPSLTIYDYAFTDTLLRGVNQEQKKKFINSGVTIDDLTPGDHDVFGVGIYMNEIIGVFFQIKGTTPKVNPKGIRDCLSKATKQIQKDLSIFRIMCSEFINSAVKLTGFAAFPMLSRSDLQDVIPCDDCRKRILTSDDLLTLGRFKTFLKTHNIVLENSWKQDTTREDIKQTFMKIFSLYVCAASFVDLPRNPNQLFHKSEEHLQKMLMILTPPQRELVKSEENIVFIFGGSGTGKTFVIKKRAERMAAQGEVLLINIVGGHLTEEFRHDLIETKNIEVVDGRREGLEEDLEALKKYLRARGKGKHILIDEVPITLGFQGVITSGALSKHWEWVVGMTPEMKSITLSFRPNDQSYTRDFSLQDVKPVDCKLVVLEKVKRNCRKIAELFLAIGDYSRRIFISLEKTLPLNVRQSGARFLPALFPIPSCFSVHPIECKDEKACEALRAAHAIRVIYQECFRPPETTSLFVVVDSDNRRNDLANTFASLDPLLPLLFPDFNSSRKLWDFRGNTASEGSFPIIIVTESEMIGCHSKNVTVIVDFTHSKWQNYVRLIATIGKNKIIAVEEEQLRTGKFSRVTKQIPKWTIKECKDNVELKENMKKAWQQRDAKEIDNLEEKAFPGMNIDWDEWEEKEKHDVDLMLRHWLSGIFGPPASGKSRRVNMLINHVIESGGRVILLQPDNDLLTSLKNLKTGFDIPGFSDIQVIHPENFRGCEASIVTVMDVGDNWLLEVISRSRTQLTIIDDIPSHEDLWNTMIEEHHLQIWEGPTPKDIEAHPGILLTLDEKERFLREPTWNDAGKRIGEKAVNGGYLDRDTGLPGEASRVELKKHWEITGFLERKGVQWEFGSRPPVALDIQCDGGGLLESLSLCLTGSLLHLPLLKKLLEGDDPRETLLKIQRGAEVFRRPIVLMGEKLSGTFLPQGENENKDLQCLLLFAQGDLQHVTIRPVVPERSKMSKEEHEELNVSFDRLLIESGEEEEADEHDDSA
ncbi:unnamed protein product, partial [Darwinula stevensoni]